MLKLEHLSKSFDNKKVLDNFNLEIQDGEIVSLLAPSGAGKTTLLNCITGSIKPDFGSVFIKKNLSIVFQDDRLMPWLSAFKNVNIVAKDESKTRFLLNLVGIDNDSFHKFPNELSGGMQKRVNMARALSVDFDVLLLDEAFAGLNDHIKSPIIKYIKDNRKSFSTLFITHDLNTAFNMSTKVIVSKESPMEIIKIYENFDNKDKAHMINEVKSFL